jgi:hypothetical protein
MTMPHATYQDAELILKLYDMRREERMRTARAWFVANFKAQSLAEATEQFPPGSDHNAYFRMVTSYWEMAASFVVRGVLHEELFFENNTEMLLVWERVKVVVAEFRKVRNNPLMFRNLEKAAEKYAQWMNANAPGAYESFQNMVNPKR